MASKHRDTFATFDILVLNVSAATLANVRSSLRCAILLHCLRDSYGPTLYSDPSLLFSRVTYLSRCGKRQRTADR